MDKTKLKPTLTVRFSSDNSIYTTSCQSYNKDDFFDEHAARRIKYNTAIQLKFAQAIVELLAIRESKDKIISQTGSEDEEVISLLSNCANQHAALERKITSKQTSLRGLNKPELESKLAGLLKQIILSIGVSVSTDMAIINLLTLHYPTPGLLVQFITSLSKKSITCLSDTIEIYNSQLCTTLINSFGTNVKDELSALMLKYKEQYLQKVRRVVP